MLIPKELSDRKQWVCWKYIERDGKATKIPFQPNGKPASSTDSQTWSDLGDCVSVEEKFSGIGFVFSGSDSLIGIDLDACRDKETGIVLEWAREAAIRFGTYAEVSPSGTGIKLFGTTSKKWTHKNRAPVQGEPIDGKHPGVEVYDAGRYFAVTGKRLQGMSSIKNVDDALDWFVEKFDLKQPVYVPAPLETSVEDRAAKYISKMPPAISGQNGSARAFHVAMVLVKGFGLSESEAFRVFASEFNPRCQPEWSEKEIAHKIASAIKKPGEIGLLRDARQQDWGNIPLPKSWGYEPKQEVQELPADRRGTLKQACLEELDKITTGRKPLMLTGIPQLDYSIGGGVDEGEVIVIAGRPSHGKSAIAMQIVHEVTSIGIPVVVISQEMSRMQLARRSIQYATSVDERDWANAIDQVKADIANHFRNRADSYILESCENIDQVCLEVEKHVTEKGCKAAFIDYVQIIASAGKDNYAQVTNASKAIRRLASKLKIPIFLLAQLSRAIEGRNNFIPVMGDLKESGQIEQDADIIVFGVWPWMLDKSNNKDEYKFYVSKCRNRGIRKSNLVVKFDPSRQMFNEVPLDREEAFDAHNQAGNY